MLSPLVRMLTLIVLVLAIALQGPPRVSVAEDATTTDLRARTERSESLRWLDTSLERHPWLGPNDARMNVIEMKYGAIAKGDHAATARMNALLASEAQIRAQWVLRRWLLQIDPETGLFPRGTAGEDQVWDYADTGADLFPHLLIAATLLQSGSAPLLTQMIASERGISGSESLPSNIDLRSNGPTKQDAEDRTYGSVEYAKDGLLPLLERLGAGPWTERLVELAHNVVGSQGTSTRFGQIPSDSSEVNGQALQVLARVYWLTGDDRLYDAGDRVSRSYLDLSLPSTGMIPGRTWDFRRERPNTQLAQLRDHGNEIVAGLVEFHLIESLQGGSGVAAHRHGIRQMLDALLDRGRTAQGLWKSAINLETGASLKDTLSDNWGYVFAAYLTQAMIEEQLPGGDTELARHYRSAVDRGLSAAADLELYPWQGIEQDGYADTIESALYLLNTIRSSRAERWVDRQVGTLFGSQDAAGRVDDSYLDGNFVRTALLYAGWQTQGVRLDPWEPGALVGAVRDGSCAQIALGAGQDWTGRLVFDAARHRTHLNLPFSYPRLNAWPEWFAVDETQTYSVTDLGTQIEAQHSGADLLAGLPIQLAAGGERYLRACPAA